ncbi:regulating synaptic membrane exocytosis protein 3 isoform X1 [Scyliorhinus canicula]|uniref:regulating synaptic membrane exocytosis protein 3 isoform X1 n=1 Tax=Scyliorhinus canicula TaxID=7830 RepID=UPI0018F32A16|nr:regulating synaptic membrane exocytosis protein 3 isoform X1 [Scyliorhinus canicula]XP_038657977.1 regulating synaptic membrane exocytosis protein 3 isoform X1 [Scyliorhinus canicula]XP_038657987.1 regulating synaptic membrane exocytosis protein 3 isoform X1 [Scyliorhinus canicula]XP_038657996.1 regulating synaptic membrane exocytosis protein 3 isoform X1 [Scyliorhinus canicula]
MYNGATSKAARSVLRSSSISGEMYDMEKSSGSQQEPAADNAIKKRRSSLGAKMVAIVGLSQWSKSTTQLNQTAPKNISAVLCQGIVGHWLAPMIAPREAASKKLRSNIRRSTETGIAVEMRNRVTRQSSRESTDGSTNSNSSDGNLVFPTARLGADGQFSDFLDGIGPAQLVGRQTLAAPSMGDIHIGMADRSGQLEVEIIQVRGLTPKPGTKALPAPYIKVYLLENGVCIAKRKTKLSKKSLDPVYQQALLFDEGPQGKVLQVIVWGDYGRMDHKYFMGMAQILLEELDLSTLVSGWYKLFPSSSLVDSTVTPITRRLSQSSLDSSTGPAGH